MRKPWSPGMKPDRRSGAWMPSPKLLTLQVFKWNGARSGASTCVKASVGVISTVGGEALTKTLSQKNGGRHPLHPATRGIDDHLHRRTRTGDPAHLCPCSQLVSGWPSYQGSPRVQSRG